MSEWGYVIAAYAVAWAGLGGYAARLAVLTRRARSRGRRAGGAA